MAFVTTSTGATLFYETYGDPSARPLVLIHGWLGTGEENFPDLIPVLAQTYHVFTPTRRGYGESLPKPRDYPFDFYHRDARDMLAFMDALNIEKAHFVGYSDGGETVLVMAGLSPERCYSTVAWGAVGYYGPAMLDVIKNTYPPTWLDQETKDLNHLDDASANQLVLGWVNAVRHMINNGGDVSLSLAKNISAPLLLLLGDQDRLNPEVYGQNLVNQTAHGQLVMFPCGHSIHREKREEFTAVVTAFLTQVDASSA